MKHPIVLDIETVPLASSMALPYPESQRNPPSNYKSEEAIAKWRETDRAAWEVERVKAYSLNPRLGRIFCVGIKTAEETAVPFIITEIGEASVVRFALDTLAQSNGEVVTWNGGFDLRFLLIRALILGVELPRNLLYMGRIQQWFRRYSLYPHFDCKAALLNHDVRVSGEGLNEWAAALGVGGKTEGIDGSKVWPLYCAGEFDAIADYCRQDVETTAAIYRRIAPMFSTWGTPAHDELPVTYPDPSPINDP